VDCARAAPGGYCACRARSRERLQSCPRPRGPRLQLTTGLCRLGADAHVEIAQRDVVFGCAHAELASTRAAASAAPRARNTISCGLTTVWQCEWPHATCGYCSRARTRYSASSLRCARADAAARATLDTCTQTDQIALTPVGRRHEVALRIAPLGRDERLADALAPWRWRADEGALRAGAGGSAREHACGRGSAAHSAQSGRRPVAGRNSLQDC
jgi:hypothetical protein